MLIRDGGGGGGGGGGGRGFYVALVAEELYRWTPAMDLITHSKIVTLSKVTVTAPCVEG